MAYVQATITVFVDYDPSRHDPPDKWRWDDLVDLPVVDVHNIVVHDVPEDDFDFKRDATILVKSLGERDLMSFAEFAGGIIMDDDEAIRVAERVLDRGDESYLWNEDAEPDAIMSFSVIEGKADMLREQVAAIKSEV